MTSGFDRLVADFDSQAIPLEISVNLNNYNLLFMGAPFRIIFQDRPPFDGATFHILHCPCLYHGG
jgi:hypothetical protein